MHPVPAFATVRLHALLFGTSLFIGHPDQTYDSLEETWQLTFFVLHAAPIIAIRLWLGPAASTASYMLLGDSWVLWSFKQRARDGRSNTCVWSMTITMMELMVLLTPLDWLPLNGLLLLQVAIVVVFWTGIFVASRSDSFSFLRLDRHLRRGVRFTLTNAGARQDLAKDLVGHCVLQLLFFSVLRDAIPEVSVARAVAGCLLIVCPYAALVVWIAALVPPHRLPYVRRSVASYLAKS
tara:strand:- start:1653 stop:2363 length:711 start_codon:yes stop_codon:yes gene_type:complete